MRKIKEVLRLRYQNRLSARRIARSCGISRSTVSEYLMRAKAAGFGWPLPENLDEAAVEARLFPVKTGQDRTSLDTGQAGTNPDTGQERGNRQRPLPDFAQIHKELQSNKHVTLQLLWQEYKQGKPEGYQYSQYCDQYRRWAKKLDLVLRQTHRGGEKLFVDYAGDTLPVVDPKTGEAQQGTLFVAVMGASNYTYADATVKADLESWIGSHVRALEYFGGCPEILTPDNLKDGVKLPNLYEPDLNPTYQEMAVHYGIAVIPARVRKPKDKAKVEAGVLVVERWILAALRKQKFFSIVELNQAVGELLEKLNNRGFRKLPGSRRERFEQVDRPALRPLPIQRFEFAQWKWSRVTNDYHVELDHHHYSVPNNLVGTKVELRYTSATVEVFDKGVRVASHARSNEVGGQTTVEEHRPESHRRYLEWNWARVLSWAANSGAQTAALVQRISGSSLHRQQALRSCLGLVRLGQSYPIQRLEAACARALRLNACSYKSVQSILKTGMDRLEEAQHAPVSPVIHDNLRGPDYFDAWEEVSHVD